MIKFRNKFTRSKYSFREALGIKLSESILRFTSNLPRFQGGLIHELQGIDEFRKRDIFTVRKPDDLELLFLQVWIFESFFIEDVGVLRQGLQKFLGAFPNRRFLVPPIEDKKINKMFEDIENRVFGSSWHNIGIVDVAGNSRSHKTQWIDNLHVFVQHFYPSFVSVGIGINPSKSFKRLIDDELAREFHDRVVLRRPSIAWWKSGLVGYSQISAYLVKSEFIEDLMLEFKMEATNIISSFFQGIFLKRDKPIPSIELFIEKQLPVKTEETEAERINLFWDSIGMDRAGSMSFKNQEEGFSLFPAGTSSNKKLIDRPYKIIVAESQTSREDRFRDIETQIIDSVRYRVEGLLPLILIHELIDDLLREILYFKKHLFKVIRGKRTKIFFKRVALKKLIDMKLRVNETYSIFQRLVLDFNRARVKDHVQQSGLPELKHVIKDHAIEYLTASLDNITYKIQNAEKGFVFINSSTDELLQTKKIESDYRLQKIIVGLTLAILLLTVALLFSEKSRETIIQWLLNRFV